MGPKTTVFGRLNKQIEDFLDKNWKYMDVGLGKPNEDNQIPVFDYDFDAITEAQRKALELLVLTRLSLQDYVISNNFKNAAPDALSTMNFRIYKYLENHMDYMRKNMTKIYNLLVGNADFKANTDVTFMG